MSSTLLPFDKLEVPGNIGERFNRVVGNSSNQIAVRFLHQTLTFHELDQLSGQIASALSQRLDGIQKPIALLLGDKVDQIVVLLGVIRAGHFYCTLSPNDPPTYLASILQDLGASILLTDGGLYQLAKRILPSGCVLLNVSEMQSTDDFPVNPAITPDAYAAIFYTSGSTGLPKGVLKSHAMILHRTWSDVQAMGVRPADRILLMYPFSTAAAAVSAFWAILTGTTVVGYDMQSSGVPALAELLEQEKITIFPPAIEFLRHFSDALPADKIFPDIRCLILSGDVLYRRDVDQVRRHIPKEAVIVHHLSSSETDILARHILRENTPLDSNVIPVGYSVEGKEVVILDENGVSVRPGEVGEIAARTAMILPGYWNRPDLEVKRIVPAIVPKDTRVYRTGDLGHFRPDGQLEFVGRKDFRVKIRGYNVDLSSVESTFMTVPGIRRAVVTALPDPIGVKRLVAYIVPESGSDLSSQKLRMVLGGSLPDYMLPSIYVLLADLPYTSTGKVDRKALPPPDWSQRQGQKTYVPPGDEIEEKIISIWQQVLNLGKVGVLDSFFDLGGDSLSAASLFAEIERLFGTRFPISLIIECDTVRKLARAVHDPEGYSIRSLVPFQPQGKKQPVYLIPGAYDEVMVWARLVPVMDAEQPLFGVQTLRGDHSSPSELSIEGVARNLLRDIKIFQPVGPYSIVGYSMGGLLAYEMAKQLYANGDRITFLGIVDTSPPGPKRDAALSDRLQIHIRNIQKLSWDQRFKYIPDRVWTRILKLASHPWIQEIFPFKRLVGRDKLAGARLLVAKYAPKGTYPGPVTIFRVNDQPWYIHWDPMEGWRTYIRGDLNLIDIPGDHTSAMKEPFVKEFAKKLQACLDESQKRDLPPSSTS